MSEIAQPIVLTIARRGLLLALSSPSGAGKTTLARRLLVANPELRASERFADLSAQLSQSEDRIALARMVYNDTVQTYNESIEQLPASLLAGALGFHRRALFELADGRR